MFFFSPHIGKHPLVLLETVVIEIVAGLLQLSLRVNNAVGKASVLSHVISFAQPAVIKMGLVEAGHSLCGFNSSSNRHGS